MTETWRVALASGEVREGALICDGAYVSVRHEGGLLVSAKVREILAPGESTRAEAIAAARREGAEAMREAILAALHQSLSGDQLRAIRAVEIDGGAR